MKSVNNGSVFVAQEHVGHDISPDVDAGVSCDYSVVGENLTEITFHVHSSCKDNEGTMDKIFL